MKRFVRGFMLAALLLTGILLLSLCVSAAETTEGADDAYYKVTNADGGVIGYHNTLQTAIDAVTDGGTIYVEKDVPAETQVTITASNGIDFSIVGGSGTGAGATRATITMTGGAPSTTSMSSVKSSYSAKKMIYVQCGGEGVTNGSITLQNVTFASDNRWYDFIHVTGNGDNAADKASLITLSNVQMSFASCYGIWFHQAAELVIEGEDTLLENTSTATGCDASTLNNILRTNGGADNSSITVKAGELVGTVVIQSTGTYAFSNCTVDGAAFLNTSAQTFSLEGVTWNGSIILSKGSDTVSIKDSALDPDSTFITGGAVLELSVEPAGITLTDTAVLLSGEGRALVSSTAYAAKITVSGLTATVSGGAVLPTPELAGSFSGTKLTVTDTYSGSFLLDFSGDYEVASQADVVALIKTGTAYAAYEIADGWHAVTLNNADLTVTLAGDAATQQNTTPFISVLEGELVGVEPTYEVTDASGALIGYYSTLQAAINAVTEGGTVTLLKDSLSEAGGVELNPNGVSYVLDGAGYSIQFISAATYTTSSGTSYQYLLWYTSTKSSESIELRDVTLLLDSGVTGLDMLMRTSGDSYGKAATAAKLTLDNVVCEISSSYGIWLYETNHLTITGENTTIVNNGGNIWRTNPSAKNSKITIEAGVVTGKTIASGGAVTTYLTGGTVTVTSGLDFGSTTATGYGNTVYLQGATVNGDITFSNTAKLAENSNYLYNKFTMTSGTLNGSLVVNASALKATVSIEGGSINATGSYAIHVAAPECSVTAKDVSIRTSKTVFYAESGSDGTVLDIESGSYTCRRLLYIYSAATVNIADGTFTSCATEAQYEAGTVYFMQYAVGGAALNVSGGSFVANEYTHYILGCYSQSTGGPRVINITGGSFEGGKSWIFINQSTTLTIDGATFADPNKMLGESGAIRSRNNGSETSVSITVKSGSFTISEETHTPLFWIEEETLTVLDGNFDVYRLVKIDHFSGGIGGSVTIGGGFYKISGNKAIQAYHAGSAKFDLTVSGGTFILSADNAMFINRADAVGKANATFKSLSVTGVSILSKDSGTVLWDDVTIESTAPATITYANETYYTYFKSTATDATIDVATADDTYKGASVFVSATSDTTGIRFITSLSESVIATLKEKQAAGSALSFGTVIAPAEYVTAAGAFTVDALGDLIVAGNQYVDIPVQNSYRDADGDGIPETYSAALINLKVKNYTRVFAAISYVKIDGVVHYGSYNLADNARSIEEVATGLLASGTYEEAQLSLLKTYAGFTPLQEHIVTPTFTAGRVDATSKAVVSADGYVVSDVIHLAKAGTVLTFSDSDGSFAGSDTYVISRWTEDGTALHEPYVCYAGDSTEIVTTVEGVRYYTYVSSHDNEYVRISYSGSGTDTTVSVRTGSRRGTLLQNETAYAEYVRTAFLLDSKNETYHEELEGIGIVAIAPSTLDNKAIAGDLWIDLLADKYNMTLYNHSVSGSTIANDQRELPTNHGDYAVGSTRAVNSFVERLSDPTAKKGFSQTPNYDVQIVYFCGGGNDLTRGIGVGEISLDNTDTETLCGAINFCIAKIKELFPNALILSETTTPSSLSYTFDFNEGEEAFTMTRVQYYQIVAQILALHGIASYDSMNEEVTGTNIASEAFREQYYMDPDDVKHMNVEGMKLWMPLMDDYIAEEYKKFLASKS